LIKNQKKGFQRMTYRRNCQRTDVKDAVSKCNFGLKQIKVMDHILTADGSKPDNSRIKAILDISVPKNKNAIKKLLATEPVLQYFDISKPMILSVDASKDTLGGVLLQNNLPSTHSSKALTKTEKYYAQIEKRF
ncbi:hypothetical protein ILUMI_14010, partial [Ignelater luminosus]